MKEVGSSTTTVLSVRVGELLCPLTVDSGDTVASLQPLLASKLGRSLAACTLLLPRPGRRATVRLVPPAPEARVADLAPAPPLVLGARGRETVRVALAEGEAALEMPVGDELAAGELLATVRLLLGRTATRRGSVGASDKLLLVKYPHPPDAARSDDWEVLGEARNVAPMHIRSGYRLLCCSADEWEAPVSDIGSVRAWFNCVVDWERQREREKVLKSRLRLGVPSWCRGAIWGMLLTSHERRAENPGLYASLVAEKPEDAAMGLSERWESDRRVIFRDVCRTFPTNPYFTDADGPGQRALQNILVAWHSMEPDVGYCQGINFIAAVFLLYMDEETAFWSLHSLLKLRGFEDLYRSSMPLLHQSMTLFQNLLEKSLPILASYFALNDIYMSSFASPWFHTLFSWRFPLSLVARIFDIVFREGFSILFRFGLALLKHRQADILNLDPSEVLIKLQDVKWLLDDLGDDDWIAMALRVTKTREMHLVGQQARTREPLSVTLRKSSAGKPLVQMAKRMQSKLSLKSSSSSGELIVYEGPESIWTQPDEGVLLFDEDALVVAGSPEKLVGRLTGPRFPGQIFTDAFLLTFRSFMTPLYLAQLLVSRLENIPRPVGMTHKAFDDEVIAPIHLRVFNVLRLWLVSYPRDFDGADILQEADRIVSLLRDPSMADRIRRTLSARPRPSRPAHPASIGCVSELNLPVPDQMSLWSAAEFAQHLFARDWHHYNLVRADQLVDSSLSSSSVVKWNAKLASWIEWRLLESGEREQCLERLDYFLAVASECLALNNVSGACVITLALRSVEKLFQGHKFVANKLKLSRKWAYLNSIVDMDFESGLDSFFDRYHDQVAIPWIHPFMTAISMIHGEQEMITVVAVNFRKRVSLLRVVQVYKQFQGMEFNIVSEEASKVLFNCVWGWRDIPLAEVQALAKKICESRWVKGGDRSVSPYASPRGANSSPRGSPRTDSPTGLQLGRRKSNVREAQEK